MAKKDSAFFGLITIVAIIGLIISKIVGFIIDNILPIGIFAGAALIVYGLIRYTKYRDAKRINKIEIQNKVLASHEEQFEHKLSEVKEERNRILYKIECLKEDLLKFDVVDVGYIKNDYNPINAIQNLQNVLKEETITVDNIWDSFFDYSEYNLSDPKLMMPKNFKELFALTKPTYFNLNNKDNEYLTEEVQDKKNDYNIRLAKVYEESKEEIDKQIDVLIKMLEEQHILWDSKHKKFNQKREQKNNEIESLKTKYSIKSSDSIEVYYQLILDKISYDPNFIKSFDVEYKNEGKALIIEYLLPSIEQLPSVKEFRYIKTRNEYKEINYSPRELEKLYSEIIYRIVLDLIHVCFKVDKINAVNTIVFNGWSNTVDKATGHLVKACILSVVCKKDEFVEINLPEVDPKECFKKLKGISAHKISNIIPIKPIISIERTDSRFIDSRDIAVDSSTNLASMDWQDFEHLIREIFEKEFKSNNGEVKVTQSSRDGGVDAVAFDPDPIKGGKIIIQAKRYTNVVGVSSVRDLYGTVVNEGATKGILVTTSDYGSDSFKFAQDKPLTLINGGKLLYLLEKHGYKARINIKEAREQMK